MKRITLIILIGIVVAVSLYFVLGGVLTKTKSFNTQIAYSFVNKEGLIIGYLHVDYIDQGIFSDLYISDAQDHIIYKINREGFFGKDSDKTEIPVTTNIYGYKFDITGPDSFSVNISDSEGNDVSDNVTIFWNYEKNAFEVLLF